MHLLCNLFLLHGFLFCNLNWHSLFSHYALLNSLSLYFSILHTLLAHQYLCLVMFLDGTTYKWVSFFTHIPFVVNCTFTATLTERLQQHPLLFTMNHTDHTFFLWRLHLERPSQPGHSTILLRSESLNGKCVKLHTVAASNNRDYLMRSLYYCLFAPHI